MNESLGFRLKAARKIAGLTLVQACEGINWDRSRESYLSYIESGRISLSPDNLEALLKLYGFTLESLETIEHHPDAPKSIQPVQPGQEGCSTEQAALMLGTDISTQTVVVLIRAGHIKARKVGKRWVVNVKSVRDFLAGSESVSTKVRPRRKRQPKPAA